jgi:hypothetical protein
VEVDQVPAGTTHLLAQFLLQTVEEFLRLLVDQAVVVV